MKKTRKKRSETPFGALFSPPKAPTPQESLQERAEAAERHGTNRHFLSRFFLGFRKAKLYFLYRRFAFVFQPFVWIYRAFRVLFLVLAWIETSALFLLLVLVFLTLLPVFSLLFLAFFSYDRFRDRQALSYFSEQIQKKHTIVLFGGREELVSGCHACMDALLIFVADRFSDPKNAGLPPFSPYLAVGENRFLVRESLFFRLLPRLSQSKNVGIVY